jgi:D-arabinose 1-dehydrogenase-like Zn-dependent alcohol dehydrogenase
MKQIMINLSVINVDIRHSGAMPGDVVAVLGIGGLGHLGVQFANKLGFCTVAIARGSDKEAPLSMKWCAPRLRAAAADSTVN